MSDRKSELERKKAKLEQMRQAKLQREKEKQARFKEEKDVASSSSSSSNRNSTPNDPKWKEAEKILEGLDIPLAPSPIPFNAGGSFRSESPKVGGDFVSMQPSLLAESLEVQPRLFVSHGPDKGKPERFPGGAELPIELPPPVVEPPARRARNRRAR